jgi:hypothetical protein
MVKQITSSPSILWRDMGYNKRSNSMAAKTSKTGRTTKRPAKGMRTHMRRVKQAASKDTVVTKSNNVRRAPPKVAAE